MHRLKTSFTALGAVILLLAFTFLTLTSPTSLAEEKAAPSWEWTKENPKPVWWKWENDTREPMRGGYIHSASSRYIGLMNPNHWPVSDWVSINKMYEGLVYIQGDYKPTFLWLAKSVTYPDSTTCIMTLRKGVTFHDGTDFSAESVKYLNDYIQDKKNGCWNRSWLEPVESISVLDAYTVKWTFKRPWAGFLGMMATVPGHMISEKALQGDVALKKIRKVEKKLKKARKKLASVQKKANGAVDKGEAAAAKANNALKAAKKKVSALEEQVAVLGPKAQGAKNVDQNPVGSGPYMLEEGKPGNYLKMKRNPNWWFGKSIGHPELPELDGLIVFVIPDESVRLASLRAGKLDYIYALSPMQYESLKDDPRFNVTSRPHNTLVGLSFNHAQGPCQDIRVRKAISHAIDRKALLQGLMSNRGQVASCVFPSTHWCHNPNLAAVQFDPELSRKLLAEAGYKDGLTITGFMGNTTTQVNQTEAIKAMLEKVGITWKVDALDTAAASDRSRNLEFDLATGRWSYIKEPDMIATGRYHPDGGFNNGRSKNEKAIALIDAGKQELDLEKRKNIYWDLEKVLYENYEDIWMWWPILDSVRSSRLLGYDVNMHILGGEAYSFTHPGFFKDGLRH